MAQMAYYKDYKKLNAKAIAQGTYGAVWLVDAICGNGNPPDQLVMKETLTPGTPGGAEPDEAARLKMAEIRWAARREIYLLARFGGDHVVQLAGVRFFFKFSKNMYIFIHKNNCFSNFLVPKIPFLSNYFYNMPFFKI
jgi:hypothetical protein